MRGAGAIAGNLPANRLSSLSCSFAFAALGPRRTFLFLPDGPRTWSVIPLQSRSSSSIRHRVGLRASIADGDGEGFRAGRSDPASLDDFLVFAEILCIAPAVILAIGNLASCVFPKAIKPLAKSIPPWQFAALVGAVAIGRAIRVRQWRRFCRENGASVNLLERIEKLEEDFRTSTKIVRVLSRQLEKLGIRFRVTRRTLKDPIAQTSALAQRNSEATQILAVREEMLEKELAEIQNALLAMQEQQRKQLELILAIGRAGKMIDS